MDLAKFSHEPCSSCLTCPSFSSPKRSNCRKPLFFPTFPAFLWSNRFQRESANEDRRTQVCGRRLLKNFCRGNLGCGIRNRVHGSSWSAGSGSKTTDKLPLWNVSLVCSVRLEFSFLAELLSGPDSDQDTIATSSRERERYSIDESEKVWFVFQSDSDEEELYGFDWVCKQLTF